MFVMRNNFFRFFLLVFFIFVFVELFEHLAYLGDEKSEEDRELRRELAASVKKSTNGGSADKSVRKGVESSSKTSMASSAASAPVQPVRNCRQPLAADEIKMDYKLLTSSLKRRVMKVRAGLVFDADKRSILWQKDMKRSVPIASMTKMMTCLLALQKVELGELNLKQKYKVTRSCTKAAPTKLWLDTREVVDLESLCRGMMIMSANDAAWLISEIVAGDAAKFVRMMNVQSLKMGMKSFRFYNANGLPEGRERKNNMGSPLDLARLAELLLHYPDAVRWTSTKTDYFNTSFRKQPSILNNHNGLLGKFPGINGMKTGFTYAAMFCSTVTCKQNGRTMIAVVTGMPNARERDNLIAELLEWAYEQK